MRYPDDRSTPGRHALAMTLGGASLLLMGCNAATAESARPMSTGGGGSDGGGVLARDDALPMEPNDALDPVVVVRATGPSADRFPPGTRLSRDMAVALERGDRLVILNSGVSRTIEGPGVFTFHKSLAGTQPHQLVTPGRTAVRYTEALVEQKGSSRTASVRREGPPDSASDASAEANAASADRPAPPAPPTNGPVSAPAKPPPPDTIITPNSRSRAD